MEGERSRESDGLFHSNSSEDPGVYERLTVLEILRKLVVLLGKNGFGTNRTNRQSYFFVLRDGRDRTVHRNFNKKKK